MTTIVIKTSDGRLFAARDTNDPDLAHVWHGIPIKRAAGGYAVKGTGRMILVRKVGSTILGPYAGAI